MIRMNDLGKISNYNFSKYNYFLQILPFFTSVFFGLGLVGLIDECNVSGSLQITLKTKSRDAPIPFLQTENKYMFLILADAQSDTINYH